MANWETTTFGALGRIFDGPHATPTRREDGPYFLNISSLKSGRLDLSESDHVSDEDFIAWTRRVTPRKDDLLFSYETRLGEAALMPEGIEACLGRRMALLRPDTRLVDPRFLLYYYLSPKFQDIIAKHTIHGATVTRIGLATMPNWEVALPPLRDQQAIAAVLGALDSKIAVNEDLAQLAVDLVETLHLRATSDVEVVLHPLLEVMDIDFGEAFRSESFSDPGVGRPLIRIRDLKTFRPQVWTTEVRQKEVMISPGDVVVGMDAEFRAGWWLGPPGLLNQRVCRARGRAVGSAFVACALRQPLNALENEKSATTVIHLNKADLVRSVIRVPDQGKLRDFEAVAEPLVRARVARALESARLASMRDELLPLLMSGKVCVRDAEKVVEGVA